MELSSPAFSNEATIPDRYTCEGADVSPPLDLVNIPTDTIALALVMDDPDAPVGVWDHWVEYDIEPREHIPEAVDALGTPGTNSWDRTGYGGPCRNAILKRAWPNAARSRSRTCARWGARPRTVAHPVAPIPAMASGCALGVRSGRSIVLNPRS